MRIDGFRLKEPTERLDVERRSLTAGKRKAMRDPFRPHSEEESEFLQRLLDGFQAELVVGVSEGRGSRSIG